MGYPSHYRRITTLSNSDVRISSLIAMGLMVVLILPFSWGYTYDPDVYAINILYAALGSPPLPGWIPNGGDPCLEAWQGVQCVDSNITAMNVENNLFSGPVPEKLLAIPNFKKDGNPFNTTVAPSSLPLPPSPPPSLPFSGAPVPEGTPSNASNRTSSQKSRSSKSTSHSAVKIIGYVLVGVVSVIIVVLAVIFCISKFQERKARRDEIFERRERMARERHREPRNSDNLIKSNNNIKKVPNAIEEQKNQHEVDIRGLVPVEDSENQKKEHEIDMPERGVLVMPPPVEKVIVNPIVPPEIITRNPPSENLNTPNSVVSYSVASLQQYTNSFSEENLIRDGRFGKLYLAELPEGKLLTVMKLDNVNSKISVDDFLDLVLSISELHHPNIVELVGYCAEFGQRLLVYNYFSKKTLHDIIHYEDDLRKKLSWDARVQVALGAAEALEYLHEGCEPPVVHQDFEPANILVNNHLTIRVAECGLAALLSSNSVSQLSGRMRALYSYEAPEANETGVYTAQCDVYSFGVVMLELLTGRKPYDSSRPRAEQHLVRWASSQLHDINALSRMVDPSMGGRCPKKSLSQFADIISRCIQQAPEFRPPMSAVVQDLTRMVADSKREQVEASIKSHRTREARSLPGESSER